MVVGCGEITTQTDIMPLCIPPYIKRQRVEEACGVSRGHPETFEAHLPFCICPRRAAHIRSEVAGECGRRVALCPSEGMWREGRDVCSDIDAVERMGE